MEGSIDLALAGSEGATGDRGQVVGVGVVGCVVLSGSRRGRVQCVMGETKIVAVAGCLTG